MENLRLLNEDLVTFFLLFKVFVALKYYYIYHCTGSTYNLGVKPHSTFLWYSNRNITELVSVKKTGNAH